jgi:hypothetical protein
VFCQSEWFFLAQFLELLHSWKQGFLIPHVTVCTSEIDSQYFPESLVVLPGIEGYYFPMAKFGKWLYFNYFSIFLHFLVDCVFCKLNMGTSQSYCVYVLMECFISLLFQFIDLHFLIGCLYSFSWLPPWLWARFISFIFSLCSLGCAVILMQRVYFLWMVIFLHFSIVSFVIYNYKLITTQK